MVLTEADTAVAREWDNPRLLLRTLVQNQRALVFWWYARDGRYLAQLILPWLLLDPDYKQALSSEHPLGHLFQAAL